MTRRLLAGLALALVAGAAARAQEGCPAPSDLERGIEVTYSDGQRVILRAGGQPGEIRMETVQADGRSAHMTLDRGLYITKLVAPPPETGQEPVKLDYDYGQPVTELSGAEPGAEIEVQVATDGGAGLSHHVERRSFGAPSQVTIAGCACAALEFLVVYEGGSAYSAGGWYLPDFGFILRGWQDVAETPRTTVTVTGLRVLP